MFKLDLNKMVLLTAGVPDSACAANRKLDVTVMSSTKSTICDTESVYTRQGSI